MLLLLLHHLLLLLRGIELVVHHGLLLLWLLLASAKDKHVIGDTLLLLDRGLGTRCQLISRGIALRVEATLVILVHSILLVHDVHHVG